MPSVQLPSDLEQRAAQADLVSPGPFRTVERFFQILRNYNKRQLFLRLWNITLGKRLAVRPLSDVTEVEFHTDAQERFAELAQHRVVRTDAEPANFVGDLEAGSFTLLGERRELGNPVDWSGGSRANAERLWQFQLHYHEYLLDAVVCRDSKAGGTVEQLLADWLDAHPASTANRYGNAWHPYCISRRLPIWLQLLALEEFNADLRQRILTSIAQQAEFLCQHLETDLGGNHLLENARGLALAGSALCATLDGHGNRQQHWLATAERILNREMPKQLLSHGEHFERSPMYHCQVLGSLLQIALVAQEVKPSLAGACRNWARPMWIFLQSILHSDGEIPLFGDSCFGESYPVDELERLVAATGIAKCSTSTEKPVEASPYWVWRQGGDTWIVDGGAAAADALPAHGHCDLGGFEASIDGVRWFVDGGLFGYGDDSMRRFCRSSLAHNVVTVDDRNQFDVWSRFRMGYRVKPDSFATGQQGDYAWAYSSHHAYRRLGVGKCSRITAACPNKPWVCIEHVEAANGQRVVGRLHLGPHVKAEQAEPNTWILSSGQQRRFLRFSGVANARIATGWYSPRFGQRIAIVSLEYEAPPEADVSMGWTLSNDSERATPTLEFERKEGTTIASLRNMQGIISCHWKLGTQS